MSTIDRVAKFWPQHVPSSGPTLLMRLLAVEFEMAGTDDQGIEKICTLIGQAIDDSYIEGVNAVEH